MTVTNGIFDFQGADLTSDTSIASGGMQSGMLTEQGVTFSFSSNASNANFSSTFNLSVSEGTATLTINDMPSEEFFSDLVIAFGSSVGGNNSIVLSRTQGPNGTVLGTPVTTVITNGQINASATVAAPAGQWNAIRFISGGTAGNDFLTVESITATINCFTAGTMITTSKGETRVQDLIPGDRVRTADGRLVTVKWLGQFDVDTRLQHPAKVNPICIAQGALGSGLPKRDLLVSPDHAIEIDGTLYNAGTLVNGSTIYQKTKMPMDGFTYYHVETEAHELLLAEGVAAESFVDYAGRDMFENGEESTRVIAEMDLPRVSTARLVPDHIRERLAPMPVAAE